MGILISSKLHLFVVATKHMFSITATKVLKPLIYNLMYVATYDLHSYIASLFDYFLTALATSNSSDFAVAINCFS